MRRKQFGGPRPKGRARTGIRRIRGKVQAEWQHSPVRPVYETRYGRHYLVGHVCDHCGQLLTVAGNFSDPVRVLDTGAGMPRFAENKAHTRRLAAAWERIRRAANGL